MQSSSKQGEYTLIIYVTKQVIHVTSFHGSTTHVHSVADIHFTYVDSYISIEQFQVRKV